MADKQTRRLLFAKMRKTIEYSALAKQTKVQAYKLLWFAMFILICGLYMSPLRAELVLNTQQDAIEQVDYLYSQPIDLPVNLISQLENIKQQSIANDWQQAVLESSVLQAEIYLQISEFNKAKELYASVNNKVTNSNHPSLRVRLNLIDLAVKQASGKVENLDALCRSLIADAISLEDARLATTILLNVASSQYQSQKYGDAIQTFNLAYDKVENTNDIDAMGQILSSMGNVYLDQGLLQNALPYYEQALELAYSVDHKFGKSIMHSNIGSLQSELGNYELAKEHTEKALALNVELNNPRGIDRSKVDLAFIDFELDNLQSAIDLFEEALPGVAESGDTQLYYTLSLQLAITYAELKKFIVAEKYLLQAENLLSAIDSLLSKSSYHMAAAEVYAGLARFEDAFYHLKENKALNAQLQQEEKQQAVEKYQAEFDSQLKDSQNQALKAENELKNLQITEQQTQEKQQTLIIVLIVTLLVVATIFLVILLKNRNHFKSMALRDYLTDSPNRRAILHYAQSRFKEAQHTNMDLSIGLIDLDKFKMLNDNFGHDTGDEVLRCFSQSCKEVLRAQDRYGRFGGEEWLLVFSDTEHTQINIVFERLRKALNSQRINNIPEDFNITFSMGVAQYDKNKDKNLSTLIARADKNLYKAKHQGRDRIVS